MASSRIAIAEVQSWTPAIDPRAVEGGQVFILSGKNYCWDVKGPKSGFGSIIAPGGIIDAGLHAVQSVEVGGRNLLITDTGVYDRRWTSIDDDSYAPATEYWFRLGELEASPEIGIGLNRWTSAYVGFGSYICHPIHGIFKVLGNSLEVYAPPGLDEHPIAIAEANGRLAILGRNLSQWSGPFDAEDLNPALGGAGFQVTAEWVPGTPLLVTGFQGGFIVWTDAGIVLFEYVGDEVVFRPDRVVSQQYLLNMNSACEIATGENIILTQQGLFRSSATSGMSPMTPQFNEFLRDLLSKSSDYSVRLDYNAALDHLYVSIMDSTSIYIKTYVLTIAIDKWGEFSESHRGIVRLSKEPGAMGWVDLEGYVHQFVEGSFVESKDGELLGLNSEIEIGYIRPAQNAPMADVNFEIHELLLSARETITSDYPMIEEDWNGAGALDSYNVGFYHSDTDYNNYGVDYYDESWNQPGPAEDYNELSGDEDLNDTVAGQRDFDWNDSGYPDEDWNATPDGGVNTDYIEDWGLISEMGGGPDEDWNSIQGLFNMPSYGLTVLSNLDGFEEELAIVPDLAITKSKTDFWTCMTYGHNHRIRLTATQPWEKFHLKFAEITVVLAGQQS